MVQAGEKESELTENSFNEIIGVIQEIGSATEKVSRHAGILNNTANES